MSYPDNNSETKDVPLKKHTTELQETPEDPGEEKPTSFKKLLTHFAATTTAHGIGRIADASSALRRVLWCAVSVGLYAAMFWMCILLVIRYRDKPVVSRTEMSFEEVRKLLVVRELKLNVVNRIVRFIYAFLTGQPLIDLIFYAFFC